MRSHITRRDARTPRSSTRSPVLLCALGIAMTACSTARPLAPLAPGQWAAELSAPMLWVGNRDFDFPVGNVVVGGRYGLGPRHELRFRLHPAVLITSGIVGAEAGGAWHVWPARGWVPALHVTGDLSVMAHPASFPRGFAASVRGAVDVALLAHFEPLAWLWPYVVLDSPVILASGAWVPSALVGLQLRPGDAWEISLESGWAGFTEEAAQLTQPYMSPLGRGALWMGLGVAYRFAAPPRVEAAP